MPSKSVFIVSEESTPKERLRKYKEELTRMAEAEGRTLELKERIEEKSPGPPEEHRPRPPESLESPAKREMREAIPSSSKRRRKSTKDRMLLLARERAITSSLRDLKERKERLELVYKRKLIGRDEFEKRKQALTDEGQKLLKEKADVDKQLSR